MTEGKAKSTAPSEDGRAHVLPVMTYLQVYGALIVLTGATVAVSVIGLGVFSVAGALAIAIIKTALVVGFFMHLRYEVRFFSLIFFGTLLFLALFFGLTMADVATRGRTSAEEATFAKKKEARDAKKARKWLEEKKKRDALLKKKAPPRKP
jgi:cytochrome c oxidase subunit 4